MPFFVTSILSAAPSKQQWLLLQSNNGRSFKATMAAPSKQHWLILQSNNGCSFKATMAAPSKQQWLLLQSNNGCLHNADALYAADPRFCRGIKLLHPGPSEEFAEQTKDMQFTLGRDTCKIVRNCCYEATTGDGSALQEAQNGIVLLVILSANAEQ